MTKKIFALIITAVMFASLSVIAFADENNSNQPLDEKTLYEYYDVYLRENGIDTKYQSSSLNILGEYNNCVVFFGSSGTSSPMEISRYIDGHIIQSYNIEYPYDLGLYACKGSTVYTLEQAVEQKLFKISDIVDLLNRDFKDRAVSIEKIKGDVNRDDIINLQDVVLIQRNVADLISFNTLQAMLSDLTNDGMITMLDVITLQRIIVGL